MAEISQPADEPYDVGDRVRVYLGADDLDAEFHGRVCAVQSVFVDDLATETGRRMDMYSYTVRDLKRGVELPPTFRHWDLVPAEG